MYPRSSSSSTPPGAALRLFLCGDVMLGRGIDQILPRPSPPILHEPFVRDARDYVQLARAHGAVVPATVGFDYVWGEALAPLRDADPRIVNLETAVTRSAARWRKPINYRMHPDNAPVLQAASIDCCVLANNHVLDWGVEGLLETLATLESLGIATAGAGADHDSACAPAQLPLPDGRRVLVFAAATDDSGVDADWAASGSRPGVHRLADLSDATLESLAALVAAHRRSGDIVIFSLHWGSNWGYAVDTGFRRFAHGLVERAQVDLVHGHSSHHVRPLEVHRGRLILYGCGDLLNDYEGIEGHEPFRSDLGLLYFANVDRDSGSLRSLDLAPTRCRNLRITRASIGDASWLQDSFNHHAEAFGAALVPARGPNLALRWRDTAPPGAGS